MYYVRHGSIPQQRHTQHRASDGSLYAEELFGVEGFTGRSSLLYHLVPPTRTHGIEPVREIKLEAADEKVHRHHLTKTGAVEPKGDAITGRVPLYFNNDVVFGIVRPAEAMPSTTFYRNGVADEMLYVHEGTGVCDTVFGPLRYGPGDYLVLPIGTTWRLDPDPGSAQRILYLEAPSEIEPPKRYRNDYGQLLEHAPYSQRDLHAPDQVEPPGRPDREHEIVAGAVAERPEDRVADAGALVDIQHLVGDPIAVELAVGHRGGRSGDAEDHVVVEVERDAAADDVALRLDRTGLREAVSMEAVVGRLELDPAALLDLVRPRRRRQVVEEGAATGESLDPEQLLGVEAAVRGAVLGVALPGDAAAGDVVHEATGLLGTWRPV